MIMVVHRAIKGSFYFYFTIAADWRFSVIKYAKKKKKIERTQTFP